MKNLWTKWTGIALVKRILVGLILGAILGVAAPGATSIAILGDVFVGALKAIAPLLVFFLVISSLCNAGSSGLLLSASAEFRQWRLEGKKITF